MERIDREIRYEDRDNVRTRTNMSFLVKLNKSNEQTNIDKYVVTVFVIFKGY